MSLNTEYPFTLPKGYVDDEGKLVVDVGVAPVKPAEFVIFRISQWQGGAATAE